MSLGIFDRPLLQSAIVDVGGNQIRLTEITAADYYRFVLDASFTRDIALAESDDEAMGGELAAEAALKRMNENQSREYRTVAASMLANHAAVIEEKGVEQVFADILLELEKNLTPKNLTKLMESVNTLMMSPLPKGQASIEDSSTDSPKS